MKDLTGASPAALPANLAPAMEKARAYAHASSADNTKRAYRVAWSNFVAWCEAKEVDPLPASPATVGLYLADAAEGVKVSTLRLRLVAISQAHRTAGHRLDTADSAIRRVMSGIARTKGVAVSKKEAVTSEILRDCIRAYAGGGTMKAKRDRALLAVGFFAALRRSEIASVDVADVSFTREGVILTIPRRKSDQEGQGTQLGLPAKQDVTVCPVAALRAWVEASGVIDGALFRSVSKGDRVLDRRLGDKDIARIVKGATAAAGYDAAIFGGHSLRSGFITTCARKGVPERIIAGQSGHKSINVLRGYVRRAGVFNENAATLI
jgi:integrase